MLIDGKKEIIFIFEISNNFGNFFPTKKTVLYKLITKSQTLAKKIIIFIEVQIKLTQKICQLNFLYLYIVFYNFFQGN